MKAELVAGFFRLVGEFILLFWSDRGSGARGWMRLIAGLLAMLLAFATAGLIKSEKFSLAAMSAGSFAIILFLAWLEFRREKARKRGSTY